MKSISLKFDQGIKKGTSNFSSNVRLVNCYCASDPGGRTDLALQPIPGSSLVSSVEPIGVGCRGAFRASTGPDADGGLSTLYFVFGNSVFRYTRRNTVVKIGSFASSNLSGSCTFAENQAQTSSDSFVYVCDQQSVYKFESRADDASVATTWSEIGALPFRPDAEIQITPAYITWSDYRLILTAKDSNAWFYSETGTDTFLQTNTYFGESSSDRSIRVQAHAGALWSFGAYSYDIFTRTGNRQNPYANPKTSSGRIGLASAESLAVIDDFMFWLGRGEQATNGVYVADRSGAIRRISDIGIESILKDWKYQESSYGFAYIDRGQVIYCLTSQFDAMTLCYNLTTGLWHQASSSSNGSESFWDVAYTMSGYSPEQVIFGSRASNKIAQFNRDVMTDYAGRPVTRLWQSPVYTDDLKRFRVVKAIIDAETGTSESYTRDVKLWVQMSNDGGRTWKERVDRSLGVKGDYGKSITVFGGGLPRNLVMRIGTSDAVPVLLYQIKLIVEECSR